MSFVETLKKYTVADLKLNQKVVEIKSKATLEEGFSQLVAANVLSAPVWDEENKTYTGFLDMRDLVSSVVFIAESGADGKTTKTLGDLFVNAKYTGGAFTTTYFSRRNPFKPVKPDATLDTVVEALARRGPGKVKRVPVLGGDGKVVAIVSQTTVVRFLEKHLVELPISSRTVGELDIGSSPVLSVDASEPAIEAFRLMDTNNISGMAITDGGKLVGNISSRDLKVFIKNIDFDALLLPIGEFVKNLRQMAIDIKAPTITLQSKHTFGFAVERLTATKVHRVFIIDGEESFRPISVVALVDVLHTALAGK